ncbi:hypothetical protein [Enterococcus sp. AZ163]|uniref:hypothetical protein n=1 Tax=Enterococcus sp. AZ163 TaxID=2774638 RepID=UPI003D2D69FA
METPEKQSETSFDSVKESASVVLGDLMSQLQRLEEAMEREDMGAVYQIYWNELPVSIQQSSNANHEMDNYFTSKLDREFLRKYPFMQLRDQATPVLLDYQLGSYYRDRAVIQLDATQPSVIILPEVKKQWKKTEQGAYHEEIEALRSQENDFDARIIAARSEIEELELQIQEQEQKKAELEDSKGLLNRKKIDDEIDQLNRKILALQEEHRKWLPFVSSEVSRESQKIELAQRIKALELEQAIALKELRIINKRFGSLEEMEQQMQQFVQVFLNKEDK